MTNEEWKQLKNDNARAFCEAIEANAEQKIRDLCNEEIDKRFPRKVDSLRAIILYHHRSHKFSVVTELDAETGRVSPLFTSYNEALMFCGKAGLSLDD